MTLHSKLQMKKHARACWLLVVDPPYSHNTTTNIGKKFLDIIDTCFPPTHKLHRLLNRNTVKLSCSCMPNMKQIIASHNKTLINTKNAKPITQKNCNCRQSKTMPSKWTMPDQRCSIPSDSDKTRQQGRDLHWTDRKHIQNTSQPTHTQLQDTTRIETRRH